MSTNILGIFCISVIIYDVLKSNWTDLPYHAVISVIFLSFFYGACLLLGDTISLAILLIPAVVIVISLATVWFMEESLHTQGCCMQCSGTSGSGASGSGASGSGSSETCPQPTLKATPSPLCPSPPRPTCPPPKC